MDIGGRPTDYNEAMQDKADTYIDNNEKAIPSIAGLSLFLGVNRSTIYEWKKEHPRFSNTLAQIMATQEVEALNSGLDGTFNATIAKLVLANHGYHDKADNTLSGADGGNLKVDNTVTFVGVDSGN